MSSVWSSLNFIVCGLGVTGDTLKPSDWSLARLSDLWLADTGHGTWQSAPGVSVTRTGGRGFVEFRNNQRRAQCSVISLWAIPILFYSGFHGEINPLLISFCPRHLVRLIYIFCIWNFLKCTRELNTTVLDVKNDSAEENPWKLISIRCITAKPIVSFVI